ASSAIAPHNFVAATIAPQCPNLPIPGPPSPHHQADGQSYQIRVFAGASRGLFPRIISEVFGLPHRTGSLMSPAAARMERARQWPSAARRALGVHVERIERAARGHEQPVALEAAEADVGAALGQADAADQLALRRE